AAAGAAPSPPRWAKECSTTTRSWRLLASHLRCLSAWRKAESLPAPSTSARSTCAKAITASCTSRASPASAASGRLRSKGCQRNRLAWKQSNRISKTRDDRCAPSDEGSTYSSLGTHRSSLALRPFRPGVQVFLLLGGEAVDLEAHGVELHRGDLVLDR